MCQSIELMVYFNIFIIDIRTHEDNFTRTIIQICLVLQMRLDCLENYLNFSLLKYTPHESKEKSTPK